MFAYYFISLFILVITIDTDKQIESLFNTIQNKRVAFLTNPTGVDNNLKLICDIVIQSQKKYNTTVVAFFAPEHGLRGDRQAGAGDDDYVDPQTGLPVYSLYGKRVAPTQEQLSNVDMFIYNIQDVGARYYTYIWTLTYSIQVLAKLSIPLVIFDRPNPLGRKAEGCVLSIDAGLIGRLLQGQNYSIPVRYGLTIGQLITYLKPYLPQFDLRVIKMFNYNPSSLQNIQSSKWILSSPNMPTLDTAFVYPGMGILQGTSMSEGRGTTRPFQISGVGNISAQYALKYFQNITINGAILRPVYFTPTFSKFQNNVCGGIQIHVTDKKIFEPVRTAFHVIKSYLFVNPNQTISTGIDRMVGFSGFSAGIRFFSPEQILSECKANLTLYENERISSFLYSDTFSYLKE